MSDEKNCAEAGEPKAEGQTQTVSLVERVFTCRVKPNEQARKITFIATVDRNFRGPDGYKRLEQSRFEFVVGGKQDLPSVLSIEHNSEVREFNRKGGTTDRTSASWDVAYEPSVVRVTRTEATEVFGDHRDNRLGGSKETVSDQSFSVADQPGGEARAQQKLCAIAGIFKQVSNRKNATLTEDDVEDIIELLPFVG